MAHWNIGMTPIYPHSESVVTCRFYSSVLHVVSNPVGAFQERSWFGHFSLTYLCPPSVSWFLQLMDFCRTSHLAWFAQCIFRHHGSKIDSARILHGAEGKATSGTDLKFAVAHPVELHASSRMVVISSVGRVAEGARMERARWNLRVTPEHHMLQLRVLASELRSVS